MSTSTLSNTTDTVSLENYEGTLVTRLHTAVHCTHKKFMSSIKHSTFKSRYRRIYKNDKNQLKNIYEQFCTQLAKTISDDLDLLCAEQRIDYLLNNVDWMKQNQDPSQNSWRPSGDPEEDLRDHYYQLKLRQKESLEDLLSKLKIKNEELSNTAAVNHSEIMLMKSTNDSLHDSFTKILESFSGANDLLVSKMAEDD